MILLFCICLFSLPFFTSAAGQAPVRVTRFAEVQITLDENFTLADVESLPLAPHNEIELAQDSDKIKVQIPAKVARKLLADSANVEISRNFILLEPTDQTNAANSEAVEATSCFGSLQYGENTDIFLIEDNAYWYASYVDLSFIPTGYIVNCIDVHYVVEPSWSFIDVALAEEDAPFYILESYVWGGSGTIIGDEFGITDFNGEQLSQVWYLLAYEYTADGSGYIDSWWIKLYYADPGPYCSAGGNCFEYISRVQVGTIDNSSACDEYADYTHLSTDMQIGTGYPITVTNGSPYATDECGIWVDWNQDYDFDDPDEEISVSGGPASYAATITPPPAALTGSTRIRIRLIDNAYDTLNPCGFTEYGEVEDYTITVTSLASTIRLGGYVKTGGNPMPGIEVTAMGGHTDITDGSGYYEIEVDAPYSGAVEIVDPPQYWFFPPYSYPLLNQTTDRLDMDFTGIYTGPNTITVRGYVTTSDGSGIFNTLVEASTGQSTYSGSGGFYELTVSVGNPAPAPWSGTVTPSGDYWDFDPVFRNYSNLAADISDQNFVGTYTADPTPTISGYVKTAQGEPVKDVQIAADLFGGSAMTDANGFYELMLFSDTIVPRPYDGNVTPFKTDWSFDPPNNVYTDLAFDIADQNYTAAYNGAGCDNGWVEEWIARYNGDDLDLFRDWLNDMAVDSSGNIYVAGESYSQQTEDDYILVKYDPNGRQLWAARYDNGDNDDAEALAIDHLGNIYVTGRTEIDDIYGHHYNCTTLRYSPDSNIPDWIAIYDGPDHESDKGVDIAIDQSGFVYVLCDSYNSSMNSDIVTIKYSPDTNVPLWTARYNGPDNNGDYPEAVAVDDNGNIYVTGRSRSNTTNDDYVTIKYSPDGNELWARRYNAPPDRYDEPYDIAVDDAGNVYVTGISSGSSSINADTVKYDSDGNTVWTASYTSYFDGIAYANAMALDGFGNLYVTGYVGTATGDDYLLIKYRHDSNEPVWISKYNGTGNLDDWAWDIYLDKFGNVYVTGVSNFTPGNPITSADLMTLKYSPDSNEPLWSVVYSGPPGSLDFPSKVVVDNSGDVIVAGYNDALVTIKYDQCCQAGDIDCDRSCDHKDLGYLCDEWLMQEIQFDIAPTGGDYYVDFIDWAAFAAAWRSQLGQPGFNSACDVIADGTIDEYDLIMFVEDWLKGGSPDLWADIYPQPDGDGVVNIYDFALFAQFWMTGL